MGRCQYLGFSALKLVSDLWPPELEENKLVLFQAIEVVGIYFSGCQKLYHPREHFSWTTALSMGCLRPPHLHSVLLVPALFPYYLPRWHSSAALMPAQLQL